MDTAQAYRNEAIIGKVLKEWFASGKWKRGDIFVTTKLPTSAVHPDLVEQTLKQSLADLQLEYVDLYLIHSPIFRKKNEATGNVEPAETDHVGIWKVMFFSIVFIYKITFAIVLC